MSLRFSKSEKGSIAGALVLSAALFISLRQSGSARAAETTAKPTSAKSPPAKQASKAPVPSLSSRKEIPSTKKAPASPFPSYPGHQPTRQPWPRIPSHPAFSHGSPFSRPTSSGYTIKEYKWGTGSTSTGSAGGRTGFPAYPGHSYSGYSSGLGPREVHAKTIWTAPTQEDLKLKEEILQHQLQYGPEDPRTTKLMLKTAEFFVSHQKYSQGEQLLKELIATIESQPATGNQENRIVLSQARSKLREVQSLIARAQSTPLIPASRTYSGSRFGRGRPWGR